jgi:alcohol dehydrogenase (cytochrome c)
MPIAKARVVLVVSLLTAAIVIFSAARRVSEGAMDWPVVGGDTSNTRFSSLAQVTTANVKQLGGAWMVNLKAGNARSTPVVKDGLMFVTAGLKLFALNPTNGAVVWTFQPDRGSPTNKGVTVGDGLVFVGVSDSRIVALRTKTGELVWSHMLGDPGTMGQTISAAPAYAGGLVISGLANGDYAIRARVVALDAKTGNEVWHFYTIPAPGELGHDSWPEGTDLWKGGGGGVWTTPAVDEAQGLVYFGTGNAVPQWGGELRPGDNLFNVCVVALDLKTGRYRWHYQLVHHDVWDHDIGTAVVLFDTTVNGRQRKAVAAMRTDSLLFVLDRATGKPIGSIAERPVKQDLRIRTAATQPFPVGAERLVPDCTEPDMVPNGFVRDCWFDPFYYDRPNVMTPLLATRAAPMSYSPQTGYIYATASVYPSWVRRIEDPKFFSAFSAQHVPGQKQYGVIAAINPQTGRIAWKKRMPYGLGGGSGTLTTAGGLVFHWDPDGRFLALDARTGDTLWEFQTGFTTGGTFGVGPAGGPASTYEIDGQQYVAVVAGPSVWTFKIGGSVAPLPPPQPPETVEPFAGVIADAHEITTTVTETDLRGEKYVDEYAFNARRVRVKVGTTVTWMNTGKMRHTPMEEHGIWNAGPIEPGQSAHVTFDKPGRYTYVCKDHPWTIAELIVEP